MPFYEYACKKCHHHLEILQKINDKPLKKCPECGKSSLEKLVSAPSFQLKGTGWYVTDFKNKQQPAAKQNKNDNTANANKIDVANTPNKKSEPTTTSNTKQETTQKSDTNK